MIKHYCDRCEAEIIGDVYYVTITADSLDSLKSHSYSQTLESASCNVKANLSTPRIYCKKCVEEFSNFLNS